jgi:hypothetical protein
VQHAARTVLLLEVRKVLRVRVVHLLRKMPSVVLLTL